MSDLGQLGSADQRVGLLQELPPCTLVVICAVMSLGVAVGAAEVVTTSKRKRRFYHVCSHSHQQKEDFGSDNCPLQTHDHLKRMGNMI